jgi:TolB protein
MLLRAYRLTDKIGIAILKGGLGISLIALDGLSTLVTSARRGTGGVFGVLLIVIGGLRWLLLRIYRILAAIVIFIGGTVLGIGRIGMRASGRTAGAARSTAGDAMARRSARAELESGLAEDPLRVQNRILSGLVVVVLIVLIGVVAWATGTSTRAEIPLITGDIDLNASLEDASTTQPEQPVAALGLATPVPTATTLPEVLQVRGTLAYVVREQGQTNIWAVPVGSRTPIRLTNSAEDDRDPAWSPDGTRLAYASRQNGNWDIYVYNLASGETTRMTYNLGFEAAAQWSPDGQYLVYESYQTNTHLDIFVMRADGAEPPIRLPASSDAPDFSPAWSPDHRHIAFVSWRDGNQDIYIFSLDSGELFNFTNTPNRNEDHPAWSPDGRTLAFTAVEGGIEMIYTKSFGDPDSPAEVFRRGRTPAWSPDGNSIAFAVDTSDSTLIAVAPFVETGVTTEVIQAPVGASHPAWTVAPLPPALVNTGGVQLVSSAPLYEERVRESSSDPPYGLGAIDVNGPERPYLSERVNDSFNALRVRANEVIGWDFLGRLSDALWDMDHRPQPGEPRRNWHMTGRAVSFNRNLIVGFPPPVEIVREDTDLATYWRVYVRVADDAQNGQLGEPLRRMPWNFASAESGDVEAYEQGGRIRNQMPDGYYVDLTQLAADYGWARLPAGADWRANFNARNYWMFVKSQGLTWYDAMRELYTEGQLGGFAPTATPQPTIAPDEDQP